jgi:hypothetical protein
VRGVETDVAEPSTDDIDLDAGLEEVHGRGVPEDVRADAPVCPGALWSDETIGMAPDDLVDAKASQRPTSPRREHRGVKMVGSPLISQALELAHRLFPQRTGPPLVTLTVEARSRSLQIEIGYSQVRDLLDPCARVVQEEQENSVSQCGRSTRWQSSEERPDLIPVEETSLGRCHTLGRDRSDALGDHEHLGYATAEVVEEGVEECEAVIAGADAVTPFLLQVLQETEYSLESQVGERQPRDPAARVSSNEFQEQSQRVTVAAYGTGAQTLGADETLEDEGLDEWSDWV